MENNTEVLEEKKVETPKKKSPVGLIILIIVLMIGCLVGGYFINEAGLLVGKKDETEKKEEKKDTKKEEKEPVVTTYAVTDEKVRDLINNLVTHEPSRKNLCTAFEAYVLDKKVTVNDISNDTAWDIIMEYSDMEKGQKISLDSVNKAIKKFLGKDYKFDPKSVNTETCVANYIYDETEWKTNKYVFSAAQFRTSCS